MSAVGPARVHNASAPRCINIQSLLLVLSQFLTLASITSNLTLWDHFLLVKDIRIYLLVWIALLDGPKPFHLLTSQRPQSPTLSSLAGLPIMEHHPPSPLTVVSNSNPNCGISSCACSELLELEPRVSPCRQWPRRTSTLSTQSWLEYCAAQSVDGHTASRSSRTPVCF